MKQLLVQFMGTVQGVGFRFATREIAKRFAVTGFVKNEEDGSVTLVAEGEDAELQEFFRAVRESQLAPYITDMKTRWGNHEGRWKTFSIAP
jgi:acylphosphatase